MQQWLWRVAQIDVLPRTRALHATETQRRMEVLAPIASTAAPSASTSATGPTPLPSASTSSSSIAVTAHDLIDSPFGPRNPRWSYCLRCSAVTKGAGRGACHNQSNWCEGGDHQLVGFEARHGDHAPTRDWRSADGVTHPAPPFPQPPGIFHRGRVHLQRAEELYERIAHRRATQTELQALPLHEDNFWRFIQRLPRLPSVDPARQWRDRDLAAHNRAFTAVHGQ